MKVVLFAKKVLMTPKINLDPHVFDIPYQNIMLMPEDPICTLQISDANSKRLFKRMHSLVNRMYALVNQQMT